MATFRSTIEPAPPPDGPFFVVTRNELNAVVNVTLGLTTITAAVNQARDDQGPLIQASGLPFKSTTITSVAGDP